MTPIMLAIALGAAFGFALDRIGATNPDIIIDMLRLRRLALMKTILMAIGVASLLMFAGLLSGVVDPGHLSVKTAYIGVFAGGLMLGAGWAIAGYCPGTGVAALASGRIDALFFVFGGLIGAAAYMASYGWVDATGLLEPVLGGKTTLGAIAGTKYGHLVGALPGEVIGIVVGALFIAVAWLLPDRLAGGGAPARDMHQPV